MAKRQLTIIGAGPAGLTAAIFGRRAGLDVLVLEKGMAGGQINITAEIENYPGFKLVGGMELGKILREHAEKFGPEFMECSVESVSFGDGNKTVVTNKGTVETDALIIASGASFVKSGCKGEAEFTGRGVSYCAVCDGAFFTDAPVAVIGGGNSAVEEADYLTRFASKVYVIHRRDEFRAQKSIVDRALANPKIEAVMSSVVEEIAGPDMVERVIVRNNKSGRTREIPVEGVFVFVGAAPNLGFLTEESGLKRAKAGWIITDEKMETSIDGVFAAGDVREKYLRQVATAAGDGATAAMAAYEYLSNEHYLQTALFEPERVAAFFMSSIDPAHLALDREISGLAASSGKKVITIDGHTNLRLREKLGIKSLPALIELSRGKKVRAITVNSADDAKRFLG
ncbi:MAG: thioredoxin-disulfide reductase [Synergistaceae bacterium]|jgi:thioredoxin reductase (NADPH)|nr:thioredoxin-disulfide reductase [Synergistaceae bacterium]